MSSINKRAKQTNSKFHLFNLEEGYLCHFQGPAPTSSPTGIPAGTSSETQQAIKQIKIIFDGAKPLTPVLAKEIIKYGKILGKAGLTVVKGGGIATAATAGGLTLAGYWLMAYDAVAAPNGVYSNGEPSLSARLGSDPGRVLSDAGAGLGYAWNNPVESAGDAWNYSMKTGSDVLTGIGYTGVEAWNAVSGTAESAWNATSKSDFGYGWRGVAESWGEITGLNNDPSKSEGKTIKLQSNQTLEVSADGKIIQITKNASGSSSRLTVPDFITIRTPQGDVKIKDGKAVLVNWSGKETELKTGPIVANASQSNPSNDVANNGSVNPAVDPNLSPTANQTDTDTCSTPIPVEQAEQLSQEIQDTIDQLGTEAEALKGKLKDLLNDIKGKGVKTDDLNNIADIFRKDAAGTTAGSGGPIFLGLQALLGEIGFSPTEVKQLAQSIMNAMSSAGTVQKTLDEANTKQGEIVDEIVKKVKEPLTDAKSNCDDLSKRLNKTKLIQKATRKLNGLLAKIPFLGWIAKIPEPLRTIIITLICYEIVKFLGQKTIEWFSNKQEEKFTPTLRTPPSAKPSPKNT